MTEHSTFQAIAFAAILVVSTLGGATMAVAAQDSTPDGPAVETEGTVTIDSYNVTWDPVSYENNNGDVESLEAHVNDSADNPWMYTPTDVEFADATKFPHESDESWANASRWTASGATVSEADSPTNGVEVAMSAQGDSATYELPEDVTDDESKRYLQMAVDVSALSSSGVVEVRVVDADGDYKMAELNASRSSGEDLVGNATGEGFVFQRQLGKMDTTTVSGSDGTFNDISAVEVHATTGTGTVRFSLMNTDRMSKYTLGTEMVDSDGDDDLETETVYEKKTDGQLAITGLDSMGSAFDEAVIHDLGIDVVRSPADIPDNRVWVETEQTDERPGYYGTATVTIDTGVVSGYDVSWSSVATVEEVPYLEARYLTVEYAEGVGDTDPSDVDDSAWSDITSSYSSQGTNVTVDDTIQPGQTNYVQYELQLQQGEFNALQNWAESGGGAGGGAMGGGLTNLPLIGGVVAVLLGFLKRFGG
jgi:hypothetical protein